ncbi:envelope stress sensor histidine kinase BaeS [Erwinia tasmaniensis]|uniref:histidine kinase n=1 Tax=Erwinia tasmaniensis (strain DSM 17950 / CFBP 7177 / CIP 109463 / NCPPB 4357 / Et1/99) TaxID=465817 RepID=B2VIG5_ERWT9|nr:two-component system sensor histidine kinase BaeS [Erwinia tasmaniensis]CAO96354.1 Sensor protein [Erwinia tasmaniensis Et1/99]
MLAKLRIGITAKLFAAILSTCMLVLVTMHWGVRLSFEHGFVDYIKRGNEQRLILLANALGDEYQQHGSWDFLRNNNKLVYNILHSLEQNPDANAQLPPHGWRTPFWIIDRQSTVMIGPRTPLPPESSRRSITTGDGTVVGWVIGSPPERLTRSADINFDQQQRRTSWMIVGLTMLLAALVTWLMSRGLLAPVKRLVEGTHHLAAGNFTSRVEASSRDELGRLAQDFNRLASTLEKNESMRRAFMADISHELRTPLAILRGELEAIQDGVRKLTPQSIMSLQGEVATLTKLVDDVHQLSLSDEGALAYRKGHTDLVPLLELASGNFRHLFTQHPLTLTLSLPQQAAQFGDPDRLIQLFTNLLENSLRYTDPGGTLHITLLSSSDGNLLHFDDSAPGIGDRQREQIFDRFYRADASRSRASGGSGLGLAICQNIVEAHDGTIVADHSAAGGVRITIHLPSKTH